MRPRSLDGEGDEVGGHGLVPEGREAEGDRGPPGSDVEDPAPPRQVERPHDERQFHDPFRDSQLAKDGLRPEAAEGFPHEHMPIEQPSEAPEPVDVRVTGWRRVIGYRSDITYMSTEVRGSDV